MVVTAIFNMIVGAISDWTKSRFDKRTPWWVGGAFALNQWVLLAAGAWSLFLIRNDFGIMLYGLLAGLGMGLWNSLDNLLNLKEFVVDVDW